MGKRVEKVQADIAIETAAAKAILNGRKPEELNEEEHAKFKYHFNRLFFFSFALQAAEREDEEEELMELGRKAKAAGFVG